MANEVVDTNVLRIASAHEFPERIAIPVKDDAVIARVHRWLREFHGDDGRRLVLDAPRQTIREEYHNNLPKESYGRRVIVEKFSRNAVEIVGLTYWNNGFEHVADLPDPALDRHFHDLGDRKLVAAAYVADAPIVNASDGDWTEPATAEGLKALGIEVVQLLSEEERRACRERR